MSWFAEMFVLFTCGWFWGTKLYQYWGDKR